MNAFLGDGILTTSASGFLIALAFFFFLLKKYRGASDLAVDMSAAGPGSAAVSVSPEPVKVVAAPSPAPAKQAPPTGLTDAFKTAAAGGVSPAVVYLQTLKKQMEHFEKEINQLRGQVLAFAQKHDQQFDALLARMGELKNELHVQVHEQERSQPPASEPARKVSAAAVSEPVFSAEEVKDIKLDVSPLEPSPADPAQQTARSIEPAEEDILKPKGKGPVWPV